MTLPTSLSSVTLDGNDAATEFPFAFPVWADNQLKVYITGADGTASLTTNWTVVRTSGGGTVTYPAVGGTVLPTGEKITIQRNMPLTQEVDLVPATAFSPVVVETALDQQMASIQQLAESVSRAVKSAPGSGVDPEDLLQELADDVASAAASAATATTQAGLASSSASAAAASAAALPNAATIGSGKVPQSDGSAWTAITAQPYDADTAKLDVVQGWTRQQRNTPVALTQAATLAYDNQLHQLATVTLDQAGTLGDPSNKVNGDSGELQVTGASTYTLSVHTSWKMANGSAVSITPAAGKVTRILWRCDGTYNRIYQIIQEV